MGNQALVPHHAQKGAGIQEYRTYHRLDLVQRRADVGPDPFMILVLEALREIDAVKGIAPAFCCLRHIGKRFECALLPGRQTFSIWPVKGLLRASRTLSNPEWQRHERPKIVDRESVAQIGGHLFQFLVVGGCHDPCARQSQLGLRDIAYFTSTDRDPCALLRRCHAHRLCQHLSSLSVGRMQPQSFNAPRRNGQPAGTWPTNPDSAALGGPKARSV